MVKRTRFPLPDEDEPVVEEEQKNRDRNKILIPYSIWFVFGPIILLYVVMIVRFAIEVIYVAVNTPLGGFIK